MEITCAKENGITRIGLSGRLDSITSSLALTQLLAHVEHPKPRVMMDASPLLYLSSAGLRTLLGVIKKVRAEGGKIAIYGMSDSIREIIEISGFHSIIPCFPDAAAAHEAIKA
jgi:anti-anti-sigma factor